MTESRGADALTVFWMLVVMATVVALAAGAASALAARWLVTRGDLHSAIAAMPGVLHFTSLVTGTLALLLTPLVRRLRHQPPPASIFWTAIVVGLIPWMAVVVRFLGGL